MSSNVVGRLVVYRNDSGEEDETMAGRTVLLIINMDRLPSEVRATLPKAEVEPAYNVLEIFDTADELVERHLKLGDPRHWPAIVSHLASQNVAWSHVMLHRQAEPMPNDVLLEADVLVGANGLLPGALTLSEQVELRQALWGV